MTQKDFGKGGRQSRRATSRSGGVGRSGRMGAINLALLFAVTAIAVSLVLTPMLSDKTTGQMAGRPVDIDGMSTGSIPGGRDAGKHYTIRRSVLQDTPGSVCIISPGNGNSC